MVAGNVGADFKRGLVGRSAELDQLRLAVRQVADGTGQAILITGEAGIGKTRVVTEGLDAARRLGVQVFWGAAEELEQRRPSERSLIALASAAHPRMAGEPRSRR